MLYLSLPRIIIIIIIIYLSSSSSSPSSSSLSSSPFVIVLIFELFYCKKEQPLTTAYWRISCLLLLAELWRAKRACGAPWVSKSTHPRKFGNHVTVHRPPAARPSAPQGNQCSIPRFLASLGAQEDWYCTHIAHQCCDQLTAVKTGSCWPVSPDRIAGSGVDPSSSSIFWSYPLTSY